MFRHRHHRRDTVPTDRRLFCLKAGWVFFAVLIVFRLLVLQVFGHQFYLEAAEGRHNLYQKLFPERGRIYFSDLKKTKEFSPLAINQDVFRVVADPQLVDNPLRAARILAGKLEVDEGEVLGKLNKEGSRYEIIKKQISEDLVEQLKLEKINGLIFERERFRFYPERDLASQIAGYYGFDSSGEAKGHYGLEGYFNDLLAGEQGYLSGEQGARGAWLPLTDRQIKKAVDGADLYLTIDRTLEYVACQELKKGIEEYQAAGGTVIILNPQTGAILAMCNEPGFDPNNYNQVDNIGLFNNSAIFTPYEPGSVFKAVTMAGALDAGRVTPETKYIDKGFAKFGGYTIKNAADKVYGEQTMIGVIKESINTGAIFAAQQLGNDLFKKYVKDFGFGVLTGIELDTEVAGNINSLEKRGDIYTATASFGQGVTVTSLQLAAAFSAIANGGKLYKPYLVSEIHYADGKVEKKQPQLVRQVIKPRTAKLLTGMLTVVVQEGHGKRAQVPGYYIAGKTGTAQVPNPSGPGYLETTKQTFVGFGPVDNPQFVMLVKYDEPERRFAEYSAVPTFGAIAKFLLQYLEVPPG